MIIEAIGATFIITRSRLLRPAREYLTKKKVWIGEMLSCGQCVGFHIGLGANLITGEELTNCFIVSLFCFFIDIVIDKIKKI